MDLALRLLNAAVMIAVPLMVAAFLAHRYGVRWTLFGWGALTFVGSQIVHLPLLQGLTLAVRDVSTVTAHALVSNAIILGLAAGICEEGARYVGYRYLVPDARRWAQALMLGAGHGGMEALLLGILSGVFALQTAGPGGSVPLLGALERVLALTNHLALSVIVLQVFVTRSAWWLLAAIAWHAALDAVAVYGAGTLPPLAVEGALAIFAIASIAVIVKLRPPSEGTTSRASDG
jgi:uncharacterized membrane protein YhfC